MTIFSNHMHHTCHGLTKQPSPSYAQQQNMDREKMKTTTKPDREDASKSSSISEAFFSHVICALALAFAFWVANDVYSINLVSDPSHTLRLISVIECPFVILLYSRFRRNPEQCSYRRAVGRGILGIPAGALLNALGAIALGAPIGIQYFTKTLYWSLLMSLFTFVPAASVFGSSWMDWQRIYARTKPVEVIDYMICLPAHGAVIGAWFGAWPMPLDWERPWQEWPICVSYGSIAGYFIAMVVCITVLLVRSRRQHLKGD